MIENSIKLQIIKENIIHNYETLQKRYGKVQIMPVLKANGYGLGAVNICQILYEQGVRRFCVAKYNEAREILDGFANLGLDTKGLEILVFETIVNEDILKNESNLLFSANSIEHLQYLGTHNVPCERIHIKLDLGFGRYGIAERDFTRLHGFMKMHNLVFGGIYSHLFGATHTDARGMIELFESFVTLIGTDRFESIHILSSEHVYDEVCELATHVRIGQLIYGICEPDFPDNELRKTFRLLGKIESVKPMGDNKYLAYLPRKKAKNLRYLNLAMIKLGYGEGFPAANTGSTVLIHDREYDIMSVSMDYAFINVDDSVKFGDTVELYYNQDKFYERYRCKVYEYLSMLSRSVTREVI